ncbi:hypothetical protein DPX16_3445 [Anabarilius grahami]|uniref:Uncharacterized protein n=1 Tax=Anabarilius grahami TaxID=495550 RepID=A0A3N0XKJ8_ANAGA|nr:hypothetical protein DPX16_3445 [Anabarilius grahami]
MNSEHSSSQPAYKHTFLESLNPNRWIREGISSVIESSVDLHKRVSSLQVQQMTDSRSSQQMECARFLQHIGRDWNPKWSFDDSIGLECFIQLSIRVAMLMQSCLEEHQGQQSSYFLHQPEAINTSEPGKKPMQTDTTRLTLAERQRQLTQGLCLYCGAGGHVISAYPVHPPHPMVNVPNTPVVNLRPLTTIVMLTA